LSASHNERSEMSYFDGFQFTLGAFGAIAVIIVTLFLIQIVRDFIFGFEKPKIEDPKTETKEEVK
jgi:hypothetical protein